MWFGIGMISIMVALKIERILKKLSNKIINIASNIIKCIVFITITTGIMHTTN
jgi:hypothetical protein